MTNLVQSTILLISTENSLSSLDQSTQKYIWESETLTSTN